MNINIHFNTLYCNINKTYNKIKQQSVIKEKLKKFMK